MDNPGYIANMKMFDLGAGGSFALWGFRASVAGQSGCYAITSSYDKAFGENSDDVLALMQDFAYMLGNAGRRRLSLGCTRCGCITADELSIVAVLASAQLSGKQEMIAHLTWLLGKAPNSDQCNLVSALADHFLSIGMVIQLPDIILSSWSSDRDIDNFIQYTGTA